MATLYSPFTNTEEEEVDIKNKFVLKDTDGKGLILLRKSLDLPQRW